jgi:hypothetical protein
MAIDEGERDFADMFREMEAERDIERDQFGILARGVPALEAYHARCPSEGSTLERLIWHQDITCHIEKSLPRLGKWRRTKATVPGHVFDTEDSGSRRWPDQREDWDDIIVDGKAVDFDEDVDLEALYETHDEFARRCDEIWDEAREEDEADQSERSAALLQMVFCHVYYGVRLVRALKARKAARATA